MSRSIEEMKKMPSRIPCAAVIEKYVSPCPHCVKKVNPITIVVDVSDIYSLKGAMVEFCVCPICGFDFDKEK